MRKTKNKSGPGIGVVALYCAIGPHTGLRVGVDEDGRRTWRPVHRSSPPIARWLLFVVKGFSNIGSRRMRSDAEGFTLRRLRTAHCRTGPPHQDNMCGLHEQRPQVLVAAFGDLAQDRAISRH